MGKRDFEMSTPLRSAPKPLGEMEVGFINDAEEAISKLQTAIREVKNGKRGISEWTTLMSVIYDEGRRT